MKGPWRYTHINLPLLVIMVTFATHALGASITLEKVIQPNSWLKETAITTGFAWSICTYQALNGITEGYHFSQETKHIINEDNYHVAKTGRDIAGISTGIFTYAQFRDSRKPFLKRTGKVLGGALLARDFFEWGYKAQRYGNPFDYSPERNRHAVVYFAIRNGALVDMYIGTGKTTGPIVDIAFAALGLWLLNW